MNAHTAPQHGWGLYWLIWFTVSFAAFLGPEIYALVTNWRNTLSNTIWSFEEFKDGQPIWQWSAAHLLFMGVFTLTVLWLIGHFGFGLWR